MAAAQQPPPVPPTAVPAEGQPDQRVSGDERTWAVISHAVSFVEGGILGPLVVYLIKKDHSPFVAFHALQSLYFGLAMLVTALLTAITLVGPVALAIVYLIYEIMACVKSYNGEWYRLPLVGKWAERSHPIPQVYPMPGTYQPQPGPGPQPPGGV
jgi:uncharacterized Tic20 family protein